LRAICQGQILAGASLRTLLDLRSHFPVLERTAYLNAGTCGPLPRAARTALEDVYSLAEEQGRRMPYWERSLALHDRLRQAYSGILGASADDVALTTSTSEGVVRVVAGLELGRGDEILTSDEEHPGLLGPLLAARARRGVTLRSAPLAELASAVGPATKLVACSHVGWQRGDLAPSFASLSPDVPVLLDGAQGAGAVPVDLAALGCAFYAAAGQKWLCGPTGTGMLYVAPAWQERLAPVGPTYLSFVEPYGPIDAWELHPGARRHDTPALGPELTAPAVAATDLLAAYGWDALHARARELASALAATLRASGRTVAPRDETTLVAFEVDDPPATLERLSAAGVAVRDLPGTPWLRASVGPWNDESDLDRLLAAL
jgi:L-cysteine/cystine lyase